METTKLSTERVEELRKRASNYGSLPESTVNDILDDYSALKAEIERLRADCAVATKMLDLADGIIEKQGAELLTAQMTNAKVCERNKLMDETFGSLLEKNINLEEQLAKQAPLTNALLQIANEAWPSAVAEQCMRSVARAALKYREGEK